MSCPKTQKEKKQILGRKAETLVELASPSYLRFMDHMPCLVLCQKMLKFNNFASYSNIVIMSLG